MDAAPIDPAQIERPCFDVRYDIQQKWADARRILSGPDQIPSQPESGIIVLGGKLAKVIEAYGRQVRIGLLQCAQRRLDGFHHAFIASNNSGSNLEKPRKFAGRASSIATCAASPSKFRSAPELKSTGNGAGSNTSASTPGSSARARAQAENSPEAGAGDTPLNSSTRSWSRMRHETPSTIR